MKTKNNNTGRSNPLRVLAVTYVILCQFSNEENPMTREAIIRKIGEMGNPDPNRKTIRKCLDVLGEMGCEIITTPKGCYLANRIFEPSEIIYLIDFVMTSRALCMTYTADLVKRLNELLSVYDVYGMENVDCSAGKTENHEVFYTIDTINRAIRNNRQISFFYGHYKADKKLHPVRRHVVSPCRMVSNRQNYYLISYDSALKDTRVCCIEKIMNIEIEPKKRVGLEKIGYRVEEIASGLMNNRSPYMYSGEAVPVELRVKPNMIDYVLQWFGKDVILTEEQEFVQVKLLANPTSMRYWALQFIDGAEVVKPPELRRQILDSLTRGVMVYHNTCRF